MNQKDLQKLIDVEACEEGIEWASQFETLEAAWNKCDNVDYMGWAIEKIKPPQKTCVELAVELAELVLPLFETKYPDDNRPRKAIETAKQWLKNPSKETAKIARAIADAVWTATNDATACPAACCAARTAAWAAAIIDVDYTATYVARAVDATYATYSNKQQICDIIRKHINPFKQNEEISN